MRLDHLLSKEHFTAFLVEVVQSRARTVMVASSGVAAGVRGGAQGWNADQFGRPFWSSLVRPVSLRGRGCGTPMSGMDRFVGTLLGPEGAGPSGEPGGSLSRQCSPVLVPPVPRGVSGLAGAVGGCLVDG